MHVEFQYLTRMFVVFDAHLRVIYFCAITVVIMCSCSSSIVALVSCDSYDMR